MDWYQDIGPVWECGVSLEHPGGTPGACGWVGTVYFNRGSEWRYEDSMG